ncbi:MAG: alpha/beta fold hydrolase [Proteobacteria bacterium]|nr:alpha/beta fold hydrolase [Pseudomonadota bacterium]
MLSRLINVAGRHQIRIYEGGSGPQLLYMHGAGGLLANDPFLARLAQQYRVTAPLLPGYEDSDSSAPLRTMLDFTLFGFDVWETLKLDEPMLVGHSMGGMIAAEMAALNNTAVNRLALICPAGLWLDAQPIPDLFAKLPFELPELLFYDPAKHAALLSAGGDFNDPEFLTDFLVGNARRMGTAGKILFPIPDRGLAERMYRIRARTQIIWGAADRLIPPIYATQFAAGIAGSNVTMIPHAGHMVPYEQTNAVVSSIAQLHN